MSPTQNALRPTICELLSVWLLESNSHSGGRHNSWELWFRCKPCLFFMVNERRLTIAFARRLLSRTTISQLQTSAPQAESRNHSAPACRKRRRRCGGGVSDAVARDWLRVAGEEAPVGAVTGNWWRVAGAEADWFSLVTSYSLPATADFVGPPYQSDFFSERQNFFETPSTRTRTSSSEGGVEGPEARAIGKT